MTVLSVLFGKTKNVNRSTKLDLAHERKTGSRTGGSQQKKGWCTFPVCDLLICWPIMLAYAPMLGGTYYA